MALHRALHLQALSSTPNGTSTPATYAWTVKPDLTRQWQPLTGGQPPGSPDLLLPAGELAVGRYTLKLTARQGEQTSWGTVKITVVDDAEGLAVQGQIFSEEVSHAPPPPTCCHIVPRRCPPPPPLAMCFLQSHLPLAPRAGLHRPAGERP